MNKEKIFVSENFNKNLNNDIVEYIESGGFSALEKTFQNGREFVIEEIKKSDLLGRGGAGYPTWMKLEAAYKRNDETKYLICNADEGEPGTFKDRDLLALDPYKIIEGMIITGFTIGANEGYVYIREEYQDIQKDFNKAIEKAKEYGYLGRNVLNTYFDFSIKVHTGAGAYVCGETTALVESMHGKTCRSRLKLPRVGEKGYKGKPTVVNNVETIAYIAAIIKYSSKKYLESGIEGSDGTKLISLCGNIKNPGTYEVPFGISLKEILEDIGGGAKDNRTLKYLQSGGASGSIIPDSEFHLKYTYKDFKDNNYQIGSGSIVVCDDSIRKIDYLLATQRFFYHESCGKCTPCREGNKRLVEILEKICVGDGVKSDLEQLEKISNTMKTTSLCGLGQSAPNALLSVLKNYRGDCEMYIDTYVKPKAKKKKKK